MAVAERVDRSRAVGGAILADKDRNQDPHHQRRDAEEGKRGVPTHGADERHCDPVEAVVELPLELE